MRTSYPLPPLDAEPAHIHPANIINYKINKDVANWPKYQLLNSNEANKEANRTLHLINIIKSILVHVAI